MESSFASSSLSPVPTCLLPNLAISLSVAAFPVPFFSLSHFLVGLGLACVWATMVHVICSPSSLRAPHLPIAVVLAFLRHSSACESSSESSVICFCLLSLPQLRVLSLAPTTHSFIRSFIHSATHFFFLILSLFDYFEKALAEEAERDRIPSRLHAVSAEPSAGLDPMNHEIVT